MEKKRIVIMDTDIGGDIDDTWALAMMLKSPELNPRLIVTATADTVYRAKIVAKLLQRIGRSDIGVGIGLRGKSDGHRERQKKWIDDYSLAQYPGVIHQDGIQAMIDLIENAPEPICLIAIGPLTNIAEMIRRRPTITAKIDLTAMMGSINKAHEGVAGAIAEFNVVKDIKAAQTVFASKWRSITITPLDTCGIVVLKGELYQKLFDSKDKLVKDLIENYLIWGSCGGVAFDTSLQSSILFDTVAVHLAYSTEYLEMEQMQLVVNDDGFMRRDKSGTTVNVALNWTDLGSYNDFLVQRLLSGEQK
jgi:inosine-uridine nucleoside N-ribohydrolase